MNSVLSKTSNEKWLTIWNMAISFLFILTYFINGITRYKHLIAAFIYLTAAVYIYRERKSLFKFLKNKITFAILFLFATSIISIIISFDPYLSYRWVANTITEKVVLVSISLAIVLAREDKEKVGYLLIASLLTSFFLLIMLEGSQYIQEYRQGIMPFSHFNHRHISDMLIFIFPALLVLKGLPGRKNALFFYILLIPFIFLTLGTMQRGTWLSILIPAIIWAIVKREYKLSLATAIICLGLLFTLNKYYPENTKLLFHKLEQTNSGLRYSNGTQGSALDLILDNPIKGYGLGEKLFYKVYNEEVSKHPEWVFRHSIGPHNLALSIWFGGGIIGLISLLFLLLTMLWIVIKNYCASQGVIKDGLFIVMLALIGDLFIRGLFETVRIENIAILCAFTMVLTHQDTKSK